MNERLTPEDRKIIERAREVVAQAKRYIGEQPEHDDVNRMTMDQYIAWRNAGGGN